MNQSAFLLALAVTVAACGTADDGSSAAQPIGTPAITTTVVPIAQPAPPTTTDPVQEAVAPAEAVPGTRPVSLSIEAAMLPESAFPPPWEPQHRTTDRIGFDNGQNQTDCDPYWELEGLRGSGGGHALWWIDGGNANHYVSRTSLAADEVLLQAAAVASCSKVSWGEGGSFTVEGVPLTNGVGYLFTESAGREQTWFAITAFGDLISVVDVPMWPSLADETWVDFDADDLDAVTTQMYELLLAAPPAPSTTTTTTTTAPPTVTTSDTTTSDTTPTVPLDELAGLLLQPEDFPDEIEEPRIGPHSAGDTDAELIERCPDAESISTIDHLLKWRLNARFDEYSLEQFIGRAESAGQALELVDRFADAVACDIYGEVDVVSSSGGLVDIPGADRAVVLRATTDDGVDEPETYYIYVAAVGDVLTILAGGGSSTTIGDELAELVGRAVARVSELEG